MSGANWVIGLGAWGVAASRRRKDIAEKTIVLFGSLGTASRAR